MYRKCSVYCLPVPSVRLRLSLAPPDCIVRACDRSCADESVLYFGHAALLDFLPRTEALQIWWVGIVETRGFANQITRGPRCPHGHRIPVPPIGSRTRHGRSWCKTHTQPHPRSILQELYRAPNGEARRTRRLTKLRDLRARSRSELRGLR